MAADPEPPAELTDAQQRAIPGKVHAKHSTTIGQTFDRVAVRDLRLSRQNLDEVWTMDTDATGMTAEPGPTRAACGPGAPANAARPSVAVIGAGVSGLTAAYLLS